DEPRAPRRTHAATEYVPTPDPSGSADDEKIRMKKCLCRMTPSLAVMGTPLRAAAPPGRRDSRIGVDALARAGARHTARRRVARRASTDAPLQHPTPPATCSPRLALTVQPRRGSAKTPTGR